MFKWIKTLLSGAGDGVPATATDTQPVPVGSRSEDYRKMGNTFLADGNLKKAEECYQRAIAANPGDADAHLALGFVLLEQQRWVDARHYLEQAVLINPKEADGHYLLGTISQKQNKPDEATANFNKALELNPDFVEAHHGLGTLYRTAGRLDEAMCCFDRALSLRPGFPESRFNKSMILLLRGDFAEGLALFESRLELGATKQLSDWLASLADHPEKPRWQGDNLGGRRLLVWVEDGAGDCLMVMRYLPKLAEKGAAKILVLSDPSLTRLMQTIPIVGEVTSQTDRLPWDSFDVHCPIMSLPYLFGTRSDTIPNAVPYLSVPREMRERWSKCLSELNVPRNSPKVGLVWAGNKKYGKDFLRSISLRQLGPLIEIAGVCFISLQKGDAAGELNELGWPIVNRMDGCQDFLDTAALVVNLDLVISVDTSVAHLAGALGKPVWLLNRFESEWRWQLNREDSPWYPTMRIFNQRSPNDWERVVSEVACQLARLT